MKDRLETSIAGVNRRISTGENEHFNVKGELRWTLDYPSDTEAANLLFFDQLLHTRRNAQLYLSGAMGKKPLVVPQVPLRA